MGISQFIYSWLKDLVILFIMISLMDLVMPKGSMKKYTNFVIGLLIIFTVINPFINLGKLDFDLDKEVLKHLGDPISYHDDESVIVEQQNQIELVYREKIAQEIRELVNESIQNRIISMDIDMDNSKENFGDLKGIEIILSEEERGLEEKDISIEVKPVVFVDKPMEEDIHLFPELKTLISNKLDLDVESINIAIQKQGG